MASIVSICNLALSNLGKDNINSLTEPTAEARACNQFYAHVRDTLLQSYPWRFAGKTQSLAEVSNDRSDDWRFAYERPSDCLKIRWVRDHYSSGERWPKAIHNHREILHPYDVDGGRIYCDLSPAFLRYTARVDDATLFPPLFVEALSWHLAVRLAMPMTRDPKIRADAFQLATQTLASAQMADANEARDTYDHTSEFIEGRG